MTLIKRLRGVLPASWHVPQSIRPALSVEGQISSAEAMVLFKLARDLAPNSAIVELGSYRGRSTIALALGARHGAKNRVYAIDPHEQFQGVLGGSFGPADMAQLYRNITKAGVGDLVAVVCLPSVAVAQSWKARRIGLLWIDADHRYDAVRADLEAWLPRMTPNAIVALHDIQSAGVGQAVCESIQSGELMTIGTVDSLGLYKVSNCIEGG